MNQQADNMFLSLLDDQFGIKADYLYTVTVDKRNNRIIDRLLDIINISASIDNSRDSKSRYVVNMDDDIQEKLESGVIKLVQNKAGGMYAQIRNENGRFGPRLTISKEDLGTDISMPDVQKALQYKALEESLSQIVDSLGNIQGSINEVLQGQANDRVALYFSGLSLFYEAREVQSKELKHYLVAQALKTISDSNAQMIQQIRSDIRYLEMKEYQSQKGRVKKINEKMDSIYKCYEVIYKSAILKAAIYYESHELSAVIAAITEYGRFIERMIIPYEGMLSEHDSQDKALQNGVWEVRANSFLELSSIKEKLNNSVRKTYYLSKRRV